MAAEFEEIAAKNSLDFDTGESQLAAILLKRGASLLLTGDKRAIEALNGLGASGFAGRIACFEQLIASIINKCGHQQLRERVCNEPQTDKAVTICFSCSNAEVYEEEITAGLASYVEDLRLSTGTLLLDSLDLSAAVP